MSKPSSAEARVVLETHDVTKSYVLEHGEVKALDGISVAIHEGEMVSITDTSAE